MLHDATCHHRPVGSHHSQLQLELHAIEGGVIVQTVIVLQARKLYFQTKPRRHMEQVGSRVFVAVLRVVGE